MFAPCFGIRGRRFPLWFPALRLIVRLNQNGLYRIRGRALRDDRTVLPIELDGGSFDDICKLPERRALPV